MLLCQNAQTFNLEGSLVSTWGGGCALPVGCLLTLDSVGSSSVAESSVPFPGRRGATRLPASQGVWCLQRPKRELGPGERYKQL